MAKPIRIAPVARRAGISDDTVRQAYAVFEAFLQNLKTATQPGAAAEPSQDGADKPKGAKDKK